MARQFFPKVKEAREALKEKAIALYEEYLALAVDAKADGKYEVAEKILWNLIAHMPNEDGVVMIDPNASTPKLVEQKGTPQIQIGIALGGIAQPKALSSSVIDVTPEKDDNEVPSDKNSD